MTNKRDRSELDRLTWPEVRDAIARNACVIVPVGATEQHGYHLPLSTDAVLARELANAIAHELGGVVAPTIPYGYRSRPLSGGGQGFPGTISLSGRTFTALLEEVLGELIRHGFMRLVILNWHYENVNFVYEAAWLAHERSPQSDARILIYEDPGSAPSEKTMNALFGDGFPGWEVEHAAILETSLMLHVRPELVLAGRAVDDQAPRRPAYDIVPPPDDLIAASGTLWKATEATADKGKLFWEEMIRRVTDEIGSEFGCGDPGDRLPS